MDRHPRVVDDNGQSLWTKVTRAKPQGNVLSHSTLFIIFRNDLIKVKRIRTYLPHSRAHDPTP